MWIIIIGLFALSVYFFVGGLSLLWSVFWSMFALPVAFFHERKQRREGKAPDQVVGRIVAQATERHRLLQTKSELLRVKWDLLLEENNRARDASERALNALCERVHFGSDPEPEKDERGIPYL